MKMNNHEPHEPLRIVEVIESEVGQPRNDELAAVASTRSRCPSIARRRTSRPV